MWEGGSVQSLLVRRIHGWGQGGWCSKGWHDPWYGRPLAKAFHWVIKKRSHSLILILNYKNYPTIKWFQTTSYNLVISPSSSPGQLAAFWATRQGEPGSLPHALGLYSVHQFFQITIYCLSALTHGASALCQALKTVPTANHSRLLHQQWLCAQ